MKISKLVKITGVSKETIQRLEKWCEERNCDKSPEMDLSCEKFAAINALENIETVESKGIYLRMDGEIKAFGIAAHLTDEMGVLMFQKAFTEVKGLYQYFDNMCAKLLFSGYKYINKESDLNVPGLAKAKQSYHPAMIVRAFELALK